MNIFTEKTSGVSGDREVIPVFKEAETAAELDALLPKLLSGEIRVKEAEKFMEVAS